MTDVGAYNSEQDFQGTISAVESDQPAIPTPSVVEDRSKKANFGLQGKIKETYPDIFKSISEGQEDIIRASAASQIAYQNQMRRNSAIAGVASRIDRPLTTDDIDIIDRRLAEPTNPSSIFEDHFAKRYMDYLNWTQDNPDNTSWLKTAQIEHPKEIQAYHQVGESIISSRQLIETQLQNVSSQIEDQSWLGTIANIGKTMIPGYTDVRIRGLIDTVGFQIGLGPALTDQSQSYYRMSKPDQIAILNKIHEQLKDNPYVEAAYLTALRGQSTQDSFLNSLMLPVGIATSGIPVGALRRTIFPSVAVRDTVGGMIKSVGASTDKLSAEITAPAAAGDLGRAAVARASDDVIADMTHNDPRRRQIEGLWSFFDVKRDEFLQNTGNYGAELANQMVEKYETAPDNIISMLINRIRGERVPELRAIRDYWDAVKDHIADYLPSVDNKILNISIPYKTPLSNNTFVDVFLGNQYSKYFAEEGSADAYAKIHRIPDYSIVGNKLSLEDEIARLETAAGGPVTSPGFKSKTMYLPDKGPIEPVKAPDTGSGYAIKITVPWDETHPFTRNLLADGIKTDAFGTKTPESLWTRFLGGVLTPEETMSTYARAQRGIATFGPNVINKLAMQMGKDIGELSKGAFPGTAKRQKWNDLQRVMEAGQNMYDPAKPDTPGYTFKNLGELEYAFRRILGYSPDELQVKAYFAWKQLGELDWTLRNLSVLRNKTRMGTMSHSIRIKGLNGEPANSDWFDGIPQNTIPTNGSVLIMGDRLGSEVVKTARALGPDTEIGKALRSNAVDKAGLQVVKVFDRYDRPLQGWGNVKNEPIAYVVGRFDKKNLDFNQLPERGGGHFIYDWPFYLKQGIINQELKSEAVLDKDGFEKTPAKYNYTYEGSNTVVAVRTRAEGRELERRFEGFRELIRDKKFDEAKQFLKDNPLPYDYEDLLKKFKPLPRRNARTGRMMAAKPELDLNEPIRLMDANKDIGDVFANEYKSRYGKSFVNSLRGDNPASQAQVAFTGERDVRQLMSIVDEGGKGNPIFKLQPAQMIDPMTAMNRGLRNIANSFYFDDLKIGYMEHWLQEAAPFMNLRPGELQKTGFTLFHNPKWIKNPNSDQLDRIKQLEVVRSQHLNLVSRPGEQESYLMSAAQHLADAMYTKLGPKFVISPLSIMSMAKDGPAVLRNMAFHFKLGMFNPSQFLKQLNTWATIYGIEGPVRASQAAFGAYMHHLSLFNDNPEVIAHMGRLAERFGWRSGELQEFRDFLMNTGFDTVAGEYAARDSIWSGKVYSNGLNRFLSLGDSFFTEGERNVRYGAFAAAYRRFRDANPTGALSDANKEEILQRARLLNVNMDRAANAIWQHGLSSIPFQFQTYALRTAQLMFGKQLTGVEKARMIATYFTLYGFPATVALSGLPLADNIRKLAMDNGYEVGDGYIQNVLMEGVPSVLGQMVTGHTYNVGQAYGPSGLMNISPTLRSDQTMWQIALESSLGPSGSILANTWTNSDGLRRWGMNIYNDQFPFKWEDAVRSWKEISSIRRGDQVRQALQTGNWFSTRGEKLATDINPMDAIWMFLSGLDHQQIQDGYLLGQLSEDRKTYNQYTEKIFIENWKAGIRAAQTEGYNPNQADEFFTRAGTILKARNFPIEDYAALYAKATKDYETFAEKMNKEYNLQHLPAGQEQAYTQRYMGNIQNRKQ